MWAEPCGTDPGCSWRKLFLKLNELRAQKQKYQNFNFKIQVSATGVTDSTSRGGGWLKHAQGWTSTPVQERSPKALWKKTWLTAEEKQVLPWHHSRKIMSGKQKVWSEAKCFCLWKQQRRRGEGEMTRQTHKARVAFALWAWASRRKYFPPPWGDLRSLSLSNQKATSIHKWEEAGTVPASIYNYLKKLVSAEEREPPRASNDGSCVQGFLRNTHKLCSLHNSKKKIDLMCRKKSARVIHFTDINNMRSRSLCKYSFQLCHSFTCGSVIRQFSTLPRYLRYAVISSQLLKGSVVRRKTSQTDALTMCWAALRGACQVSVKLTGCSLGPIPGLFSVSSPRILTQFWSYLPADSRKFQKSVIFLMICPVTLQILNNLWASNNPVNEL